MMPRRSPSTALRAVARSSTSSPAASWIWPSTSINCLVQRTKSPAGISASRSTWSRLWPSAQR